jgi:hypothetical protein
MATRSGFRNRPLDVNRELTIVLDEVQLDTEDPARDSLAAERSERVRRFQLALFLCSPTERRVHAVFRS